MIKTKELPNRIPWCTLFLLHLVYKLAGFDKMFYLVTVSKATNSRTVGNYGLNIDIVKFNVRQIGITL